MNTDAIEPLVDEPTLQSLDAAGWEVIRQRLHGKIAAIVGEFPDPPAASALTIVAERQLDSGVLLADVKYDVGRGERVPAYLLRPGDDRDAGRRRRRPAVVAMHQTVPQGKDEVAGLSGHPDMRYGLELASRGYVVLAPDVLFAGGRIPPGGSAYDSDTFVRANPAWSMIGKAIYDHMRAVDALTLLPDVDAANIGAIGHSLGGYNAMFLATFDRRIRAAISSCGFCPFRGDPHPQRWGLREGAFSHLPKVSEYLARGTFPFEFHEVAAAIVPRAYFNWSAQNDPLFVNWRQTADCMLELGKLYDRLGVPHRFMSLIGAGSHAFPAPVRAAAYAWLDGQLGNVRE